MLSVSELTRFLELRNLRIEITTSFRPISSVIHVRLKGFNVLSWRYNCRNSWGYNNEKGSEAIHLVLPQNLFWDISRCVTGWKIRKIWSFQKCHISQLNVRSFWIGFKDCSTVIHAWISGCDINYRFQVSFSMSDDNLGLIWMKLWL